MSCSARGRPEVPATSNCRRATRSLLALLAVLAWSALPAIAVTDGESKNTTPRIALTQLGVERWDRESGLAGNWVRDVVQTPDGFLWIATSGGLSRFDGWTFVNFTTANSPELPTDSITALAIRREGGLWVGLEHGGVLVYRAGRLERTRRTDAIPDGSSITGLFEDAADDLWVGTRRGLWRVGQSSAEEVYPAEEAASQTVGSVKTSDDGTIWVRVSGQVWRVGMGEVVVLPVLPECNGTGLAPTRDGGVIVGCPGAASRPTMTPFGLWEWSPRTNAWTAVSSVPVTASEDMLVDRTGAIWFSSRSGMTRNVEGREETLPPEAGVDDWRVRALFEDERGDLWLGSFSAGLARLRRGAVRSFGSVEGLHTTETTAVLARPDGRLWIGSRLSGVVQWNVDAGRVERHLTKEQGLPSDIVWSLANDASRPDRVWIGTGQGLAWTDGTTVHSIATPEIPGEAVHLVQSDAMQPETLWVAWAGGLLELEGLEPNELGRKGEMRVAHGPGNGLDLHVRFLHRNRAGGLLAGGDGGLFRLDEGAWHSVLPEAAGLSLRALLEDEDGSLWLASATRGLLHVPVDGEPHFTEWNVPPLLPVHSLELDRFGGLWLSGNEGLAWLERSEHDRWRRGEIDAVPLEALSRRDGLRDAECNGWGSPASTQLPDGRLVYPTMRGIAVVDPAGLPEVMLEPEEIVVATAFTGARELNPAEPIELGRQERSLSLDFSAVEMLRPEAVVFRYRLDDFDEDWTLGGPTRVASYAHLPAGHFRFRVEARLPGQDWVESAFPLRVTVVPFVWETTWFRSLMVGLVAALAATLFAWRTSVHLRLLASRAEARRLSSRLIRAQEQERQHLAREIHDDLTQRLAGLAMLAGSAAREETRTAERSASLGEIRAELERLADDSQNLARDLHPPSLATLGLDEALRDECATFSSRTGLEVEYTSAGLSAEPPPEIGLTLYRIAQEALRNCLRHSQASRVRVGVRGTRTRIVMEIVDDGIGFDRDHGTRDPGLGLSSMTERSRLISGTLRIDSAPGKGTRITVSVRLPEARS